MNVTRRMIVIPVATVMAAGIGAGAFAVGLIGRARRPGGGHSRTPRSLCRWTASRSSRPAVWPVPATSTGSATHRSRSTPRPTRCASTSTFTDVDDITVDAHPPRCGRRQRTDRRRLRSHPGSGTVRHLRHVQQRVADEIAANPLGFYLNAHTTPFPAGAVRGQLAATASSWHPDPADTGSGLRLPAAELARHPGARVELDHRRRPDPGRRLGSLPPGATAALVNVTVTDVRRGRVRDRVLERARRGAGDQHDQLERP